MRRLRYIRFALLTIGIGLISPLLEVEIALRVMPAKQSIHAAPINAGSPVFRFIPDR